MTGSSEDIKEKFCEGASGAGVQPNTYLGVDNPEVQLLLDSFREQHEAMFGIPKATLLWTHQLSVEEKAKLSSDELFRRVAPWQKALWRAILREMIESNNADMLPIAALEVISQATGYTTAELESTPILLKRAIELNFC